MYQNTLCALSWYALETISRKPVCVIVLLLKHPVSVIKIPIIETPCICNHAIIETPCMCYHSIIETLCMCYQVTIETPCNAVMYKYVFFMLLLKHSVIYFVLNYHIINEEFITTRLICR